MNAIKDLTTDTHLRKEIKRRCPSPLWLGRDLRYVANVSHDLTLHVLRSSCRLVKDVTGVQFALAPSEVFRGVWESEVFDLFSWLVTWGLKSGIPGQLDTR
jgi:hypothetical protein